MRAATEHVDENGGRDDCLQTNFDANILYERDRFRGGCRPKVYYACETYLECAALYCHLTKIKHRRRFGFSESQAGAFLAIVFMKYQSGELLNLAKY